MTQTKHAPATPLPWYSKVIGIGDPNATPIAAVKPNVVDAALEGDAAYSAHAANSYPRLVAALRNMEQWARDLSEQSDGNAIDGLERLRREHCPQYNDARALLRELGEAD